MVDSVVQVLPNGQNVYDVQSVLVLYEDFVMQNNSPSRARDMGLKFKRSHKDMYSLLFMSDPVFQDDKRDSSVDVMSNMEFDRSSEVSGGVSKSDIAQSQTLLSEGQAKMVQATALGMVCMSKSQLIQKDIVQARKQQIDTIVQSQNLQASIINLRQSRNSLQWEIKLVNDEIEKELQKLQVEEQEIKKLLQEAQLLKHSNHPTDKAKLKAISTRIGAKSNSLSAICKQLNLSYSRLSKASKSLRQACNVENSYFKDMVGLAVQYEQSNSDIKESAQALDKLSPSVKQLGSMTAGIGQAIKLTGEAIIAVASVGSIFTFGLSACLIPFGIELMTVGFQMRQLGSDVESIGSIGLSASNTALVVTKSAGAHIDKFLTMSVGATSIGSSIAASANSMEVEINEIWNNIKMMEDVVDEYSAIEMLLNRSNQRRLIPNKR